MGVKVSINVLNYNTYAKSKICIDSCLRQKQVEYRVLLVDNNSTDDSFEKLKSEYGDTIEYLQTGHNFGYAKGNNIAVEKCVKDGYCYSLLLNSDTELVDDLVLSKLTRIMTSNANCVIVAPTVYDVTSKGLVLQPNDSLYLKWLRWGRILPKTQIITPNIELINEAHGSALLVDGDAFLKVGGFPEHYFMYNEECTLAKKIQWKKGLILWHRDDNSYVLHHHDISGAIEPWRLCLKGRNFSLEFWENYDKNHICWLFIYILYILNTLRNSVLSNNYHLLKGMYIGFKEHVKNITPEQIFAEGFKIRESYK